MSEAAVKKKYRALMQDKLGAYQTAVQMNGTGVDGKPDDYFCLRGLFLTIEGKDLMLPTNKKTMPRYNQCREMDAIRAAGGATLVVDNANFPSLDAIITTAIDMLVNDKPLVYVVEYLHQSAVGWTMTKEEWRERYREPKGHTHPTTV